MTDGGDDYVLALGFGGFGSVFQINDLSVTQLSMGSGISDAMNIGNATATSVVHADVSSGPMTLFVGTDVGMLNCYVVLLNCFAVLLNCYVLGKLLCSMFGMLHSSLCMVKFIVESFIVGKF